MAFGKVTKQDLIELGLDPEKFNDLIGKAVSKADLEALKTEITTSITDQIKAGFTELETKLRPNPNPDTNDDDKGNKGGDNEEENEFGDFSANPTAFIKKEVGKLGGAAAVEFKKMARNLAWKEGSKNLKGFKNTALKTEIEEEWKKYPAEKMAQFGTDPEVLLQQIHDMVLGRHHDEIMADNDKKDGKFNIVHSGTGNDGGGVSSDNNNSNRNKITLTEAEKKAAKMYGMTDEEWIKEGEAMEAEELTRRGIGA